MNGRRNRSARRLLVGVLLVIIVVGAVLWGKGTFGPERVAETGAASGGRAAGGGFGPTVVSVRVEPARVAAVEEIASWTGTLNPRYEVDIFPRRAGRLESVMVAEGARVEAGERIATVEHDDLLLQERQGAANLTSARASLRRAEAQLDRLKTDLERIERLYERGAATQQEVQNAQMQVEDATIQRDVAQAQLEQAEANYEGIQLQLKQVHLDAPVGGVVMRKPPVAGSYVTAATPVVTIGALDPIEVHFHVPERDIGRLFRGQALSLAVDSFPEETFEGEIVGLGTGIDEETRTLAVRGQVANPELRLRPGMFARVELVMAQEAEALTVPREALMARSSGYFVYVVEDGHARARPIKLGVQGRDRLQVLEGLLAGEQVVTVGQQRLRDGQPVQIVAVDDETGTMPSELTEASSSAGGGAAR